MAEAAGAGWNPDPYGRHELRYYDGSQWTAHVSDAGTPGVDDVNAGAVVAPPRPANLPPASPHYRPPAPGSAPAATATRATRPMSPARIVAGIGAALLVVGAFLPWAKVSAGFISLEVTGVDADNDGWVTLACGGIALLVMLVANPKVRGVIAGLVGGVAAWVSISDLIDVRRGIDDLKNSSTIIQAHASVGIGLWMSVVGAVVLVLAAIMNILEREGA